MASDSVPLCFKQAVVIGGSIAGLLAARVLAEKFEQVIILEQDSLDRIPCTSSLSEEPKIRPGVPQAHQVHVLLLRGQQLLDQWFPDLLADLDAAGAETLDWTQDCRMLGFSGWEQQFTSGLTSRTCSRVLLEQLIRHKVMHSSKVHYLDSTHVIGLRTDAGQKRVIGVDYRRPSQPTATLTADLVVDASGRKSQTPQWLRAIGYEPPQETIVNSFLGYASRWYHRPKEAADKSVLVWPKPPDHPRAGLLYPVEGNRWVLTLTAPGRDYPPIDEAEFLAFASSLRSKALYEAVKDEQPLSPVYGYRRTENCWRHYEDLKRYPEGLVVLGDAVCAFNPIYAQGITTAALGALTLQQCLSESQSTNFTHQFQKRLASVNASPWLMATGEDFRWVTTEGKRPGIQHRFLHWYVDRVRSLTLHHPYALQVFLEVVHMVKPPVALFHPAILLPVFGFQFPAKTPVRQSEMPF